MVNPKPAIVDGPGPRSFELLARWECDGMRARGKVVDAWTSTSTGRDLAARMHAHDCPFTIT